MNIVIVGSVDHGKSTLIGRLLHDTNSLPEGKLEELEAACKALGRPMEMGYIMDALEEERRDSMTIDTCRIPLRSYDGSREYTIIDVPGHIEFLRNMFTGAAKADAAILLIDITEGITDETIVHARVLDMLRIEDIVIAVNKMDLVKYSVTMYNNLVDDIDEKLGGIIEWCHIIPISAADGDNIITTVDSAMDYGDIPAGEVHPPLLYAMGDMPEPEEDKYLPMRLAVQCIHDNVILGRVESGTLKLDEYVNVGPYRARRYIWRMYGPDGNRIKEAGPGSSVGLVLNDNNRLVSRGTIISSGNYPSDTKHLYDAMVLWMDDEPVSDGDTLTYRCCTQEVECWIDIFNTIDPISLDQRKTDTVDVNNLTDCSLSFNGTVVYDWYDEVPPMGRFTLSRDGRICGVGIIA